MKIHEYQAKDLLRQYHIPVPNGVLATTADNALLAADSLIFPVTVKAQIHAGGRGKGGGVKFAENQTELVKKVDEILGMTLITPQTGPDGQLVKGVLLEETVIFEKEFYLSLLPDRSSSSIVIMASTEGGADIEETAEKFPEKIIRIIVNPLLGLQNHHIRQLLYGLRIHKKNMQEWQKLITSLYQLFVEKDCSLVEINPLVTLKDGSPLALDAKISIDDSALFRQQQLTSLHDESEEDPLEAEARRFNLNYIRLSGNVGNMVNGAGLAMATMDIIKNAGAEPANFLDVGGGATAEMVEQGFRIILNDKKVKGILVNIFGGILRCDVLARGIVEAVKKADISVPVVIRMEGTNVEEGRRILTSSGLDLITAEDLADAARKVAEMVR